MLLLIWANIFSFCKCVDRVMSYFYGQHEIPEGECTDPDPREATSEDIRYVA